LWRECLGRLERRTFRDRPMGGAIDLRLLVRVRRTMCRRLSGVTPTPLVNHRGHLLRFLAVECWIRVTSVGGCFGDKGVESLERYCPVVVRIYDFEDMHHVGRRESDWRLPQKVEPAEIQTLVSNTT
jgi:hypothetical protein